MLEASTFRFLDANDAAIYLYGYGRDELATMTMRDLLPGEEIRERPRSEPPSAPGDSSGGLRFSTPLPAPYAQPPQQALTLDVLAKSLTDAFDA